MNDAHDGTPLDPLIVTYTNYGYLPTTLNWFESLRRVGLAERALVFALSERAQQSLNRSGIACRLLESRSLPSCHDGFVSFRAPEWRGLVLRKFDLVRQLLSEGRTVLFSDADVVFRRDPLDHLAKLATDYELLIQVDRISKTRAHGWPGWDLCSGFFYVRPTERTLRLFDLERGDLDGFKNDQPLLNARIHGDGIRYHELPVDLFPNGANWYRRHAEMKDPYIVHFNWVIGAKLPLMETYGLRFHFDDPATTG